MASLFEKKKKKALGHVRNPSVAKAGELRVLSTLEEIEQVRSFWQQQQSFIYSDIDFFLYEFVNCPNVLRPHVLLVSHNNRPTCLLIARITEMDLDWRIGFLRAAPRRARGLEVLPHGLLGEPTEADLVAISEKLHDPLQTGEADFALVNAIEAEAPIVQAIRSTATSRGLAATIDEFSHWTLGLAGTFEDFVKSRRARIRTKIRSAMRALNAQGNNVSVKCYRRPSDVPRSAKEADAIAAKTYQGGIGIGLSDTPALRSEWLYAARKGWLRVYVMYLKGQPIAFNQGLAYNNSYVSVFAGYDPEHKGTSPGHFLLMNMLQSFYADGDICIYDFGWGHAAYKKELSNNLTARSDIYLFAPTLRGRRLKWTKALTSRLNYGAKELLARLKLLHAVKNFLRQIAATTNEPESNKSAS